MKNKFKKLIQCFLSTKKKVFKDINIIDNKTKQIINKLEILLEKPYFKHKNIKHLFVFLFLMALVFFSFRLLFNSYFEADEWYHLTHYLPLTKNTGGMFQALIKTITSSQELSEWQHVIPIGVVMFFLNTIFFGTNFTFYVFISLLLHTFNSFLIYLLVKEFFYKCNKSNYINFLAIISGIFFALNPPPIHNITWAAFYGQNSLSVTFFITTILAFMKAINRDNFIYLNLTALFLLCTLMTKETGVVLFLVLPFIYLIIRRYNFSKKRLLLTFSPIIVFYLFFRFFIPLIYMWVESQVDLNTTSVRGMDWNIFWFRFFTFPIRMLSQVFFSRASFQSLMTIISPIIYPQIGEEGEVRAINRLHFIYGPGNDLFVYILSIIIFVVALLMIIQYKKNKNKHELEIVLIGMFIIFTAALPLVLNCLHIKHWGIDFFDSRHYYMPSVGASLIFPFILLFISNNIAKLYNLLFSYRNRVIIVFLILFLVWFIHSYNISQKFINGVVGVGQPRKMIINKFKEDIPVLPQKIVFYSETNKDLARTGQSQPVLPFQTSFAQILTVVFYDKNPLPDSFFKTFIFEKTGTGYKEAEGRGFGYYRSKRDILNDIMEKKYSVNDVFAFYYNPDKNTYKNITKKTKDDLISAIKIRNETSDWIKYSSPIAGISFYYPPNTEIDNIIGEDQSIKEVILNNSQFNLRLILNEYTQQDLETIKKTFELANYQNNNGEIVRKNIFFDNYYYNDALILNNNQQTLYIIKLSEKLLKAENIYYGDIVKDQIEKILGSVEELK